MRRSDPPADPPPPSERGAPASPPLASPAAAPPASAALRNLRIAAVAAVLIGVIVAHRMGLFELFAEPAQVKQALVQLGPWGYLAFVGAYAALQPFGVPGTVFVMAAPLIWPWPVAFALSMTGTMAASVIGFSFARFVARDWLSRRVPARFRRYDEALAKRGFITVATLRFVFWMPQALHVFLGVSKVPFWTHFWGSFVGYLIPLFLTSYFGQKVFDTMRAAPPAVWAGVAAAVAAIALAFWLVRRSRKATPS